MFRRELPRIYELRDLLPIAVPEGAYFRDFDRTLAEIPQKLHQFRHIEADLQSLDQANWCYLKEKLAPLLFEKHETRGWTQLFDTLNEAKAYAYLVRLGCSDIQFIPNSKIRGRRTPDIEAVARDQKVLCEVKTINVSDNEATRFHNNAVCQIEIQLPDGFFRKLGSNLKEAIAQMHDYCPTAGVKRIVYVIVNFDDRLHEYVNYYQDQINQYLAIKKPAYIEVALDIKPKFYTALS